MRRKIFRLSVSRKTLLLLLTFVVLPMLLLGGIVVNNMNQREQMASQKSIAERLHTVSENLTRQFDITKRIAEELSFSKDVCDVVVNGNNSARHKAVNETIESAIEYNDYIAKIQLISEGQVIWQFGPQGYPIMEDGNEIYASEIEEGKKVAFWTPVHPLYKLNKGEFTDPVWVLSYYCGIYEMRDMKCHGVLAVHMNEKAVRELYEGFLYGEPECAWIMSSEGDVVSTTETKWCTEDLPRDLKLGFGKARSGNSEITYDGEKVQLTWEKCGDWDLYLVQMTKKNSTFKYIAPFILWFGLVFALVCVGYMYFYRKYVSLPLEALMRQMERAKNLDLQQEALPAEEDEIGVLTTTFQSMLHRIDELIEKVYVEKIKTQEAERDVMLAQINPHFLYNTLDSIRWNALSHGDKEVGKQLEALSLMLRNTLNFGNKDTTINHEIQTIKSYCFLLQARFRNEIEIEIDVDPRLSDFKIPKLLIQPLVENAYKHGLENKIGLKKIWVKVHKVKNQVVIYVADNGQGCNSLDIQAQMAQSEGNSCFALKNIRDRIKLSYGELGYFRFSSWESTGTLVKIMIPFDMTLE